jgi:hypothetical protein
MEPTQVVVVRPFGAYAIGAVITAADAIAKILTSEHADHVVKINHPATEA